MQFFGLLATITALAASTLAAPSATTSVTVSYDTIYDAAGTSLTQVACSDGTNGLLTKGFTTFGSLPTKFIGGAAAIPGWNSAECGSCWTLTFNGTSINVLAIDHTDSGFNVAQAALDKLTHNQAVALGRITATAKPAAASACGL